ncbi:MAG: sialate O-acetylesterase [Rhodobacterales bacterium]|nr:sialate O-acetylesterase [Rhodobacterales bacterium]
MFFDFGPRPYYQSTQATSSPVAPRTSVLLAIGQSNMVDQSSNDNAVPWPTNALIMDTQTLGYAPAAAPVKWLESNPGVTANWQTGAGQLVKHFAIKWCAANPEDTLIVVPCARGGTGFSGEWVASGNGRLYNETIRLLDQIFTDHPDADFLAVLAQHGEADGKSNNRAYQWCATGLIASIRHRYDVQALPAIWGEPGPGARFSVTSAPGYDVVRTQIRDLPGQLCHVATAREADAAAFDALTDLDKLHFDQASQKILGGLHYDALATARANTTVTLPDAALIWQTAGEQGWLNYNIPTEGMDAGDTLVILAAVHRSSGNPVIQTATVNGEAATMHLQESVIQGSRLGLAVGSVTLSAAPVGSTVPVDLTWGSLPLGGAISIWRIRGGASLPAGSFGHAASLGPVSVDLAADVPGTVLMLGYAVDTGQVIDFAGDGASLAEGPGNTNAAYFTARQFVHGGGAATVALNPSAAPNKVCGMVAVAVG